MASKYDSRRIWMKTGAAAKLKNLATEEKTVRRTQEIYRKAQRDIEDEVQKIYGQFGTLAENNRWTFKGLNTPATTKDINALIRAIDRAGLTEKVPERLQRRMSVIQVKQLNIWLRLHQAGKDSHTLTKDAILQTMQTSGKAWANALGAGAGNYVGFDRNICGYMMGMNWADGNFSSRLWNASEETWEKVRDELTRALANGQSPGTTRAHLRTLLTEAHNPNAKGSGGLNYDVERIIRTETAKASTQADLVRWREAGITEVQWHATFEKNTCSHCADRDGHIYKIKEAEIDEPPLHPNCRCYFTAYDEVAAKFPDTTYYKDEEGEYQEIQWAPYHSVIDEKGQLRSSPLQVGDYFWNASPWSQYPSPTTGIEYRGELDAQVEDITERTIEGLSEQFPELLDSLQHDFKNEITMHRGSSVIDGSKLTNLGGMTDAANRQLTIAYLDRAIGGNPLSQMAAQAKDQFERGFWSSPKANHTIIHELAHILSYDLRHRRGVDINALMKRVVGARNWEQAKAAYGSISKYAVKDAEEAFAETFARTFSQDVSLQNSITRKFSQELEAAKTIPRKPRLRGKIRID